MRSASSTCPALQSALPSLHRDVQPAVFGERRVGHEEVHREVRARRHFHVLRVDDAADLGEPLVGQEGICRHRGIVAIPRLAPWHSSRAPTSSTSRSSLVSRSSEDEIEQFTRELGVILEHAQQVAALDTHDVPPTAHPLPLVNVLRPDEVHAEPRSRRSARDGPGGRRQPVPRSAHPRRTVSATALELAALVRAGDRSAADVVEEHLAVVAAREPELHACNLVTDESARAAAAAIDAAVGRGEDPGPLAGVPIVLKDNLCTRGVPTTCSSRILEGWRPPYTATVVERVVAGRRDPDRQDQPRRVRDGVVHRELGVRSHPQPARSVTRSRRLERRFRGRGCGRVRTARSRLRHRRLDPPARRALRGRRREAHLRPRVALRPHRVRELARSDRPVRHHRRRRRAAPRRDLGARPCRLHVDPRRARPRCCRSIEQRRRRVAGRDRRGAHRRRGHPARGRRRGRAGRARAREGRRHGRPRQRAERACSACRPTT